ncbi:MAG TPA: L,D-transpeptidase [Azospirillaceae bacterium]|nr:L,D-transpeptidase [Azospirillaceae bacterium]
MVIRHFGGLLAVLVSAQAWAIPADATPSEPKPTRTEVVGARPAALGNTDAKALRLGYYIKEEDAHYGWRRLTRRHPEEMAGLSPSIRSVELAGRGTYLAMYGVPAESVDLAERCGQLKAAGTDCFVARLPSTTGASFASPSSAPAAAPPSSPVKPAVAVVVSPAPATDPVPAPSQPDVGVAVPEAPPRQDRIIISIADKKLYYTSADGKVRTFPVAVGRTRNLVVTGATYVVNKRVNPVWRPTPEMRRKDPKLPERVGPGPKNPMGAYSIDLGWQYIRIHGTNEPRSIGGATSSGCYRMHAADIQTLFRMVGVGTPVQVVEASVQRGEVALSGNGEPANGMTAASF